MKIIQLSDLHICSTPDQPPLDRRERLRQCITSINAHHADADYCILTGDLADDGSMASYAVLNEILSELVVPTLMTIGNHDLRNNFQRSFPQIPKDENGFTQYGIDGDGVRLLVLDTVIEDKIYGWMCSKRLEWLERELAAAASRDVYIFMHHPAFPIGLRHHEKIALVQSDEFVRICSRHGNVRRIFAGHVHAEATVRTENLSMSITRGVSQHLLFDQWNPHAKYIAHAPAYNIILIDKAYGDAVHFYDLMHESPLVGEGLLPPELEWNGEPG
ncbi:phosphodiesterase [Pararhizobium sp. O133]|uniref:phosphodiesterase n=1 Tax=Pararhizobium sp. O133 TaxID=3449278 RepID=UPI003F687CF5